MKFFACIAFALLLICSVQAQGRRGPQNRPLGSGQQNDCPAACPLNYVPTCGFNGSCYRVFSNGCDLASAGCTGRGNFREVGMQECNKRGARQC